MSKPHLVLPLVASGLVLAVSCASVPDTAEAVTDAPEPVRGLGATCGGFAALGCPAGLACFYPTGSCGRGDQSGTCQRRPELCMHIYQPVCGCDGRTYGNRCEAARDGVSVMRLGRCDLPGEPAEASPPAQD